MTNQCQMVQKLSTYSWIRLRSTRPTQGHSKYPAGDDSDASARSSRKFSRASGTDRPREREFRIAASARPPAVVSLHSEQSRGGGLNCGEAGDEIDDLDAQLVADPACAFEACYLCGAGPCDVRDDFQADRDLAAFLPAVALSVVLAVAKSGGKAGFPVPVATGE
jgi:hypothetical protein